MDKIKKQIYGLRRKGFFSIFISSAASKVITFIGGMIIVRIMSKEDYGSYTYVINCLGVLTILNDFGCAQATMQLCSEYNKDKKKYEEYFIFGIRTGLGFVIITSIVVFLSPFFYPYNSEDMARLVQELCLFPLISTVNSFLVANLRSSFKTKKYAIANFSSCVLNYIVILPLAYIYGLKGAIISKYLIPILEFAFLFFLSHDSIRFNYRIDSLEQTKKKEFIKLALSSQISSGISQIMTLVDVFVIGLIIKETSAISSYKVGTIIPTALEFIPQSVMIMAVPYFAQNRIDKEWVVKNTKKVVLIGTVVYLVVYGFFYAFAPLVIVIIFGEKYRDSMICFRILLIGFYFTSAFKIPISNIIYTQRKVKINIIMSTFGGILNCILDYYMIIKWGSVGAAQATTIVQIVISFSYLAFIIRIFKKEYKNNA